MSINQSKGYNPSIGPSSTDPSSFTPILNPNANSNPNASPLPSPGSIRKQTNITNHIYEKNLHRLKNEISLSSLSYLFSSIIQINLKNSTSLLEIERKLNNLGYTIGIKYLELASLRSNFSNNIVSSNAKLNTSKRNIKILEILNFLNTFIWINLFNKKIDSLEISSEFENQFMIIDNDPVMSKYISYPKEFESLNCESFIAGLIEGILDISYFKCEVSAHCVPENGFNNRTVYLIDFDKSVIEREKRYS